MKNTVHAMKFSETSSNVLRMIVESTAKKRIGGIPALLFLVGLNDKLELSCSAVSKTHETLMPRRTALAIDGILG